MEEVYISGQISGLPEAVARAHFERAENRLRKMGYIPVNPFKIEKPAGTLTWQDHMRYDIIKLCKCKVIFMLDNFFHSKGAEIELYIASQIGIEILFEETMPQEPAQVGCWARKG